MGGFFGNLLGGVGDLFGIRGLGGSGHYADGGLGNNVTGIANQLGTAGTGFLSGAGQVPQLSSMGAYGNIPGIMGQEASMMGLANPFTGKGGGGSPYSLFGPQQEAFNVDADMLNKGRQTSQANLAANMASQGIDDPRMTAAATASIDAGTNQNIQQAHSQAAQQAFQQRMSTLQRFFPMLAQLGGAQLGQQQQGVGNALSFLGSAGNLFGHQAAANTQMHQDNMGQLNGMLQLGAFGLGGGFGGGGAPAGGIGGWAGSPEQYAGMFG